MISRFVPFTPMWSHAFRSLAVLLVVAIAVAACGPETETAERTPAVEGAPPSPGADQAPPQRAVEATLIIEDGSFDVDQLTVMVDESTVVHVENRDGVEYIVQFGTAVAGVEVAPTGTTQVAFTASVAGQSEGQLLDAETQEVLDTIQFVVQTPEGDVP